MNRTLKATAGFAVLAGFTAFATIVPTVVYGQMAPTHPACQNQANSTQTESMSGTMSSDMQGESMTSTMHSGSGAMSGNSMSGSMSDSMSGSSMSGSSMSGSSMSGMQHSGSAPQASDNIVTQNAAQARQAADCPR